MDGALIESGIDPSSLRSGDRIVHLTRGLVTVVEEQDYQLAMSCRWYANLGSGGKVYARGRPFDSRKLYLHVAIVQPPDGFVVDHEHGCGLDNRRRHLKVCTQSENLMGVRTGISGYRGVDVVGDHMYRARVQIQGKRVNLGTFSTMTQAARAYDAAVLEYIGRFARLNFPLTDEAPEELAPPPF